MSPALPQPVDLLIPTVFEQITPAWLNAALQNSGILQDANIIALQIEPTEIGRGYIGQTARLLVSYDRDTSAPASFFVKCSHPDPNFRLGAAGLYEHDVMFYRYPVHHAGLHAPCCYHAAFQPETGASILLLEDLSHYRTGSEFTGCTGEEILDVIRDLADFHAAWWNSPRLAAMTWLPPADAYIEEHTIGFAAAYPEFVQKVRACLPGYEIPASYQAACEQMPARMSAIFRELARHPRTYIHGDPRPSNLMFGRSTTDYPVVFVDWQVSEQSPGPVDIAYHLLYACSPEQRRRIERPLLLEYYARLVRQGITGYSFEDCWHDYRLGMFRVLKIQIFAFLMADLSAESGKALLRLSIDQAAHIIDDLQLLKLLK